MLQGCHEDNVSCIYGLKKVLGRYTGHLSAQNLLQRVIGKVVKDVANKVYVSALEILRYERIMYRRGDTIFEFTRHVGRSTGDDMLDVRNYKYWPSKAIYERDTGGTPAATDVNDRRIAFPIEKLRQ